MPLLDRRTALLAGGAAMAGGLISGCGPLAIDQPLIVPPAVPGETEKPAPGWPALFGPDGTSYSNEDSLDCVWPTTGPPELWRIPVGSGYSSPVANGDDLILLHRLQDRELVSCFDAATGESRWEHGWPTSYACKYEYSSGPYGTPRIDGDRVYAAGAEAHLACLDRSTGQPIWQRSLRNDFALQPGLFGFGPGLATDEQRLYFNGGGTKNRAGIIALDKFSGETLWTATDHAMAYTMPRLASFHGRKMLLVLTEFGLVALGPADGSVAWMVEFHSKAVDTINAVTPLVQDDLVLLVAGPGPGALCLRVPPFGEPEKVWRDRRRLDSQFNSLVHHAGHVYGFTSSRQGGAIFRCVEVATGRQQWEYASELHRGQALAADGCLILLGERGHLAAVDLNPRRLMIRSEPTDPLLSAPCYSAPALHDGRLYLRNDTTLLCLNLRR